MSFEFSNSPIHVIARSDRDEAIHLSALPRDGLLRYARNDGTLPSSFRDAPLGAGPESILTIVVMDSGLALRAPRNDDGGCYTHLRIPAARFRPSHARNVAPSEKIEGAGKTGCALHPRSRVQTAQKNAHEHTGSAETLRPSPRNGFTAYIALSLATGLSCHHHP